MVPVLIDLVGHQYILETRFLPLFYSTILIIFKVPLMLPQSQIPYANDSVLETGISENPMICVSF